MELNLEPAIAFGTLLRENTEASQFYDQCTPEQKQSIILRLHKIEPDAMPSFVNQLPLTAL